MPAEISAVLTCFSVLFPFCACPGCSGCSWAQTSAAGAKNSAIASGMINLEIIYEFLCLKLRLLIISWMSRQRIGAPPFDFAQSRLRSRHTKSPRFVHESGFIFYDTHYAAVSSCLTGKFFAKTAPGRKLAGRYHIYAAHYSLWENAIA